MLRKIVNGKKVHDQAKQFHLKALEISKDIERRGADEDKL